MAKYLVIGVIAIILIVGGTYYFTKGGQLQIEEVPQEQAQQTPPQMATSTFATTTFSVVYPVDFSVDPNYSYQGFPKKPIAGVKFTIPLTMATGTNLASDTGISIESLPRAKSCTGDIYVVANVRAAETTENGVKYSVATSSEAATGNRYEEYVYAISDSKPCTAVRYFIHSTAIENYPAGTVSEFDRASLMAKLDEIRRAITLIPQAQ